MIWFHMHFLSLSILPKDQQWTVDRAAGISQRGFISKSGQVWIFV